MKPLVSCLVLTLSVLSAAIGAEWPRYYSIKMNDKLIGYAVINGETITEEGRELLRITSETSLKVALLGQERNTLLESETRIDAVTRQPLGYRMTDSTNEVVRHVDTEFAQGVARNWIYRAGDPRGEPAETKLEDHVLLLGSNNFAHWQLMMQAAQQQAADGKARLHVFLPDTGQIQEFQFTRGEPQEVVAAGESRRCATWHLAAENLYCLCNAETGELVRLELPAQQTTIELADESVVKLARKSRAEEVLTRHFSPSNVTFDDFLKVRQLSADIDVHVIGSGTENDVRVLTTPIQQFDGEKEADHIVGQMSIRSISYDGENSPGFPAAGDESAFGEWLRPSVYIESNHEAIVSKAAELTQGAKTRWDAVKSIGRWVHQEIDYKIAVTPSARLALEKREGDCGPHATLMVALLRSVKIPARLVGGLVYTPTFGGSFGQHAWVEVDMGKAGWLAIDPTTGEFEQLSATHIKLFEGMGGVLPKSIHVTQFQPPNREPTPTAYAEAKELAWKFGQEYIFKYTQGNKELGTEQFTIRKKKRDGEDVYELKSDVALQLNLVTKLTSTSTIAVALNAQPLSFTRDLSVMLTKVKMDCTFKDGSVHAEISGSQNLSQEIKLPPGAYCFDNNLMGSFVLICSQVPLATDQPISIKTFHPSSLQIIPLTLTPKAPAVITVAGQELECFECEVAPIKNTFWITRDGRFVRAKQADLVIELLESTEP